MTLLERLHEAKKARDLRLGRVAPVVVPAPMPSPEQPEPEVLVLPPWPFVPAKHDKPIRPSLTMGLIQKTVCADYRIGIQEMNGNRRTIAIVRPRWVAMYLASKLLGWSLPRIGRGFGNKDHTTVLHAVKGIAELRKRDAELDRRIKKLAAKIEAATA